MNPTKRIAIILVVIFLLPVLFFSVYEISSLNKDEKMIEEIYQKQLEGILFSVNQHSDNAMEGWIAKAEAGFNSDLKGEGMPASIQTLLANEAVKMTFLLDSTDEKPLLRVYSPDSLTSLATRPLIEESLRQNNEAIQKLIKYKKSGFQKLKVIESNRAGSDTLQLVIFITEGTYHPYQIAGLIINPEILITDVVCPRLQIISKDQFILSVFKKPSTSPIYSTQLGDTVQATSEAFTKDLWIFPNYSLGIRTQGASLQKIVRTRTTNNFILLIGLDVILVIALVLVFRNVKKEVQLAQNKSDFVSNVSHEIRTLLALISMFAETLEMDRVKSIEKKQEYYSIIHKEAHRLTGIVNKILTFSQIEAGKKTLHTETVELTTEIQGILKTYDFHLKNKGFEYSFITQPEVRVKADREAMTEIVINLIDNAIKYSREQKRIEIAVGVTNGLGWIAIKDVGLGISTADQKHIFDKFYRVSSGNLAKTQGTGLGLSLVKQLIEQQNGTISVTSELGKGSTFTVSLPIASS